VSRHGGRDDGSARLPRLRLVRGPSPNGKPETWRRAAWPVGVGLAGLAWYSADSLRHRRENRYGYEMKERPRPGTEEFARACESLTGQPVIDGNRIDVLINGNRIFPAMLEAIEAAERSIHMETYVYWRGEIAETFAEALARKAEQGVAVRVLLDALGSAKMRPVLLRRMREAGADVVRFRPPRPHLLRRAPHRSHRRILSVDGRIGFTGGVGIAREWTGDAQDPEHWRDTHVRLEGPAVSALGGTFSEHWVEATGEALVGPSHMAPIEPFDDGIPLQVVRSGSRAGDTNVEVLYFLAIASAHESIELTAAYFAPRPPFTKALCEAADRGVRVRILVPGGHIDKEFVRIAGRHTYATLLDCGVEIFEYQPTMLHAKSLVIDGCFSSVGTVNFDNRSFQMHDEITVGAFGPEPAGTLGSVFERDLERSKRIDPERWARRPRIQRVSEAAMKPLRREL
jgi:cardiolipin synthase A/B